MRVLTSPRLGCVRETGQPLLVRAVPARLSRAACLRITSSGHHASRPSGRGTSRARPRPMYPTPRREHRLVDARLRCGSVATEDDALLEACRRRSRGLVGVVRPLSPSRSGDRRLVGLARRRRRGGADRLHDRVQAAGPIPARSPARATTRCSVSAPPIDSISSSSIWARRHQRSDRAPSAAGVRHDHSHHRARPCRQGKRRRHARGRCRRLHDQAVLPPRVPCPDESPSSAHPAANPPQAHRR